VSNIHHIGSGTGGEGWHTR